MKQRMAKKVAVGRVDEKPILYSGLTRPVKKRWFKNQEQAADFVDYIRKFDPIGVFNGNYYIDDCRSLNENN